MNDLKIFTNKQFGDVRIVTINNEPYFIGKDIAGVLGYSNTRDALSKHVDDDDKGVAKCDTPGGAQDLIVINESGLYSLILSSKLPQAKQFKRWVTSEVLPAIRKHGLYAADELLGNPDLAIKAFEALKQEREARAAAEAIIEEQKPKVLFADAVETSKSSCLIGELAKILTQNGYKIGQNTLFAWLRNNGYLGQSGERYNIPNQRYVEQGLFEVKKRTISEPNGTIRVTSTTKVTGKGQQYFINKFLAKKARN